jgi:hypothetical protein
MILNPGDSNNYGPHCRNCHTGASSCQQCHAPGTTTKAFTYSTAANVPGQSVFWPVSYQQNSAVANVNGQCVDGGFSFPHRTLAVNLLKDQLWGVDFDGTSIAYGVARGTAAGNANIAAIVAAGGLTPSPSGKPSIANTMPVGSVTPTTALMGVATENLDSVCIDCHGNATYWNPTTALSTDQFGTGATGWELLLKGLP